ncbi:hypothetical protein ACH475_35000 [Streptomyces globisporus]|uniref:hypothetical protein n=1 Tax=Streptomyces globisporus TaxID=1908 RepID=UPI003791938D
MLIPRQRRRNGRPRPTFPGPRRQLRALGLRPGGHDPVAVLRCRSCAYRPGQACIHPTRAWL